MISYVWWWLVLGCAAALLHMVLTNSAHRDGVIDEDDASWMYKLVPIYVVAGPLALLYMFYVAFIADYPEE